MEYIPWDFKYFAKLRGNQILEDMQPVIRKALDATGMFVCPPSSPSPQANRNTVSSWVSKLKPPVQYCPFKLCIFKKDERLQDYNIG